MRFLAAYIMRGRMEAMLIASSLAMLSLLMPPVSIVSSGAVALVTLRRGAYEGLLVLLISTVAAAILGWLILGGLSFALLYGLVLWVPIWLIAIVLREGRQLALAIEIAVLLGAVAVIAFYLYTANPAAIWQGMLEQMLQPLLQASPEASTEKVQSSLVMMSRFMTGFVAAGTVYSVLFGLFLARWWQAVLYNPGGFRQEYLGLKASPRLALLTLVVIAVAMLPMGLLTEIARNIGVLLFVLYTFIGTAVLHSLFANMNAKRFMVPMLYVTLAIVPHVMLIVAIIGLLDTQLDIRNRQSKQNNV